MYGPRPLERTTASATKALTSKAPVHPQATEADARLRTGAERLGTPTDLPAEASRRIAEGPTVPQVDFFLLYLETKNVHRHVSGPHFRNDHLLLDEQADRFFAVTDDVAEHARKIGGTSLRSLGQAAQKSQIGVGAALIDADAAA